MKGSIYVILLVFFGTTYGFSRFKRQIPNGQFVNHPCPGRGPWDAVGHMNPGYTPQKNVFGMDFRGTQSWTRELCMKDSDGDGLTNGEELGDPTCTWRPGAPSNRNAVRGHPGFCEPDRANCTSGMTHPECPNRFARGGRQVPNRQLPAGANDHPQTFLKKNIDRGGMRPGMGQGMPGMGMGMGQGMSFGQPFQDFNRPGRFGSFAGDANGAGFPNPGLSRDFGISSDSIPGFTGFDRFSSNLDQRAIQGMGSPVSGPSFTSSLSQIDIDRSVRARMERERRLGGNGMGFSGAMSAGSGTGGMRDIGPFNNGPVRMGPMGGAGMGPGGMGAGGSEFSGAMQFTYPQFMPGQFAGGMPGSSAGMMARGGGGPFGRF